MGSDSFNNDYNGARGAGYEHGAAAAYAAEQERIRNERAAPEYTPLCPPTRTFEDSTPIDSILAYRSPAPSIIVPGAHHATSPPLAPGELAWMLRPIPGPHVSVPASLTTRIALFTSVLVLCLWLIVSSYTRPIAKPLPSITFAKRSDGRVKSAAGKKINPTASQGTVTYGPFRVGAGTAVPFIAAGDPKSRNLEDGTFSENLSTAPTT